MESFFDSNSWILLREFMLSGRPPLITQILALNTIVLMLWIVRRLRGASAMRHQTANIVQGLLIFANCVVLLNGDYKFFDLSQFF